MSFIFNLKGQLFCADGHEFWDAHIIAEHIEDFVFHEHSSAYLKFFSSSAVRIYFQDVHKD